MSTHGYDPDWEPNDEDGEAPELDPEDHGDEEEEEFQRDIEDMLSFYQEEQAGFNEDDARKEFQEKYGFEHNCRCAADWEEGNLGVVSECYLGLVADAMDTLEAKIAELREVHKENAGLRIKLADSTS